MSRLLKAGHRPDSPGSCRPGATRKAAKGSSLTLFRRKVIFCLTTALFFVFAVNPAAWPQKPADKGSLLADRHKVAKVECAQCHKDKPAAPVASAICSGCHPNVAKEEKIREKLPNPHKAHMEYPDCSDCHHVHKAPENQCAGCHNFEFRMR